MRVKLINLASSKGYSISRAARELGIKPSTGKFIVKCFRDSGKIMKKTTNQQVTSSSNCQDDS
jgi:transposase-like protein